MHLVSAGSESVAMISTTGYDGENSFVLNRHAHWVAIRSIGGAYWDLNSMLDYPSELTSGRLSGSCYTTQKMHTYRRRWMLRGVSRNSQVHLKVLKSKIDNRM